VGDGAVAFATGQGAALWQLECSRHDCADRAISTPPVSHAAKRLSHEYRQITLVLLVLEVAALDESALREIL
jgi:hypothetical protein